MELNVNIYISIKKNLFDELIIIKNIIIIKIENHPSNLDYAH